MQLKVEFNILHRSIISSGSEFFTFSRFLILFSNINLNLHINFLLHIPNPLTFHHNVKDMRKLWQLLLLLLAVGKIKQMWVEDESEDFLNFIARIYCGIKKVVADSCVAVVIVGVMKINQEIINFTHVRLFMNVVVNHHSEEREVRN